MRTGLFFGSFNPVHIGHTVIAGYLAEFANLDEVWMVVSPQNPLKLKSTLLADHHRYRLVEIACEVHPRLKASNFEFNLPKPSFTVDTLAHMREKYPQREFTLIMGADNLATFRKWKNFERLLQHYRILVYPRPGYVGGDLAQHPSVQLIHAPQMEISATAIRNAIREKRDVGFFFPAGVYEYIREMHFYEK